MSFTGRMLWIEMAVDVVGRHCLVGGYGWKRVSNWISRGWRLSCLGRDILEVGGAVTGGYEEVDRW